MEKETILKSTINCGLELFIDELINDADNTVTYAFSNYIKDYFCNYVYLNKIENINLKEVEECFLKRNLTPALYLTDSQINLFSTPYSYNLAHHDIWMSKELATDLNNINDLKLDSFRIYLSNENPKFESDYIELFDKIYINNDPSEIYSNLDNGYKKRLKIAMANSKKTYFLIGYLKDLPIAIGSVCIDGEVAGIYSGGTLKEYRGNGFGNLILNQRLKIAKNNGCTTAFLGTEKDSINHQHFKNFGFKDLFEGVCYYKSD